MLAELIIALYISLLMMMIIIIDPVLADPTNNRGVLCARLGTDMGLLIRS